METWKVKMELLSLIHLFQICSFVIQLKSEMIAYVSFSKSNTLTPPKPGVFYVYETSTRIVKPLV